MLIFINLSVLMSIIASYSFQINLGNIIISLTDYILQDHAQLAGYSRKLRAVVKQPPEKQNTYNGSTFTNQLTSRLKQFTGQQGLYLFPPGHEHFETFICSPGSEMTIPAIFQPEIISSKLIVETLEQGVFWCLYY